MKKSLIYNWWLSGQQQAYADVVGVNTTGYGEQVFGILGDSNSDGSAASIQTVSAGILFNWNGSSYDEITIQSVSNGSPTTGNVIHKFAIDYNANTGKKILCCNGGRGGSNLYPTGASDEHWMGASAPTGIDLWAPFVTKLNAALSNKSLTKPKAIFIVGLGVNDVGSGTSIANVSTALDALITNITTTYPGVPILYSTTGVTNLTTNVISDLCYGVRNLQILKSQSVTDLHIVGAGASCVGANFYEVDGIHYNLNGLNHLGSTYARWFKNLSLVSNKTARSIISSHFDDLSLARKNVIQTAIENLGSDYNKLEAWNRFKTTTENNVYFDWTFLGNAGKVGSPTFLTNNYIQTSGLNIANRWNFVSWDGSAMRSATKTDFIEGVKLITNADGGAGANQSLFGVNNSGVGGRYLEDGFNGTIRFTANDNTQTTGATAAKLEDNTLHCIARSAGNKLFISDTTVRNTTAVTAVTTVGSRLCIIGGRETTTPFDGTYEYSFKAKYSDFDLANFIAVNDYITDNW